MKTRELRLAREQRAWTQEQAAARLGVSQPYLSLLESGKRSVTPSLLRRAVRVLGLPSTMLAPADAFVKGATPTDRELAEDLANLGYPLFAHLRSRRRRRNPAELLLTALAKDDLEPRVTEALPWLLLQFPNLDTEWLVRQARLHNLQNRLGFVVNLARQLAECTPRYQNRAPELLGLERELESSRLAREDTLCEASLGPAHRRWLSENRPPKARDWNLLADWRPDMLRYGA